MRAAQSSDVAAVHAGIEIQDSSQLRRAAVEAAIGYLTPLDTECSLAGY